MGHDMGFFQEMGICTPEVIDCLVRVPGDVDTLNNRIIEPHPEEGILNGERSWNSSMIITRAGAGAPTSIARLT